MMEKQIKSLAWNTFKQTGNINTFMELMQVDKMSQNNLEGIKENENTEVNSVYKTNTNMQANEIDNYSNIKPSNGQTNF